MFLFHSGHGLLYVSCGCAVQHCSVVKYFTNSAGMPPILLYTQPKVRAQRELSGANQWVDGTEKCTILFSLSYFFADPKDNISYKHFVPWIGMYSQGFV